MKPTIHILTLLALGSTLALAEDRGKDREKRGEHGRPKPHDIFKRLDADNSGGISLDEFKASPRAQQNPEKATEIFARMDTDKDGQLTPDEFAKLHRPGDRPNPHEIFKELDKDGSGTISLDEFKAGPRAQQNPEKAAEIFAKMDADSDGQVTKDEFARFHAERRDRDGGGDRPPGGGKRPGKENRPQDGNEGNNVE